ncbi:maltase A3-like [Uranotaenia lowii]|uniref:maltase A3-like n=1 Tax=Uranotaenia lowii TaxID=190385 RepID=UPI0024796AAA|nr:maltase A3-like [Uranotaenia lowii]
MFPRARVIFLFSILVFLAEADFPVKDWWEKASFYQIYPRSFKDSDGDGIGDLNGITSKLSYLKELGIRGFWMSPIYASPMVDMGYDISDYRAIQPEYGTMTDFENLLVEARRLGLKVIMDLVPNHSSDKHEWFIKSEAGDPLYKDYYIWEDGLPNPNGGRNLPPSNWLQSFRGSAWQWSDQRQQYYLHMFAVQQPDLNYRNPKVIEEIDDIIRFWLDKGVDGFRIDAISNLVEIARSADGSYKDEPPSGLTDDKDDPAYLDHIYTQNQPETLEVLYHWREVVDQYQKEKGGDTRLLMAEAGGTLDILRTYYLSADGRLGAHMPFNFQMIFEVNKTSTAEDYERTIRNWMAMLPPGHTSNWVIGNHDRPRVGTRFGVNRIDVMNMMALCLPGVSVTYQGEEIGMTDVWISWEDTKDPGACNAGPDRYTEKSRDPCRTPFQWDDSAMAGFTQASQTWLPVGPEYRQVNVKLQNAERRSHLKTYKALMQLRLSKTFQYGSMQVNAINSDVLAITRELEGYNTYIVLMNLGDQTQVVNANNLVSDLPSKMRFEILDSSSHHVKGGLVYTDEISLLPHESYVLVARLAAVEQVHESMCEIWLE